MILRDHDIALGIPLVYDGIALTNWYGGPGRGTESDGHDADSGLAGELGGCHHILGRLERFAVAEDDDGAVPPALGRHEEIRSLANGTRERAACLSDHRRVQVVEKQVERAIIYRERRQDVAASRERQQREAVARRCRSKTADLLLDLLEPVRALIGRHHRE